jgi:topoisomerase IV subunit A
MADRDTVYTLVYTDGDSGFTYIKRFTTGGTILDKEYRCAPEGASVLVLGDQECDLCEVQACQEPAYPPAGIPVAGCPVKGAKAKGNQMTSKRIARVATSKPRWWDEDAEGSRGQLL